MTGLEIILILLLWLITGLFICSKRDWYKPGTSLQGQGDQIFFCVFAVLFTPINLIVTLIKVYFINSWDN